VGEGCWAEVAAHRQGAGLYHGDRGERGLPGRCGALAKAVVKLVRTARRVQAAGGATGTKVTDRRRAAARRARQMAAQMRARSKLGKDQSTAAIGRVSAGLAELAEKAAAEAAVVMRNGRRAVPKALSGRVRGRLTRALAELAVTIERTTTIVAQARTRLAGQTPAVRPGWSACTMLTPARSAKGASISRPSSGIRLRPPTTTMASSPATAPNTAPCPTPRSSRLRCNASTGVPSGCHSRSPPTADTASQPSSALQALGVRTIAIPRKAKTSTARKAIEHQRGFRRHVKWRTGSGGRISYLKRSYGWNRTHLDGIKGAQIWCGHGVFAHNLVKIAALAS
jgi:transposase, IS5 family